MYIFNIEGTISESRAVTSPKTGKIVARVGKVAIDGTTAELKFEDEELFNQFAASEGMTVIASGSMQPQYDGKIVPVPDKCEFITKVDALKRQLAAAEAEAKGPKLKATA